MRITNGMMIRRFNSNLNSNKNTMDKMSQKISTYRKFQTGAEDPMAALRALQVRKSISEYEQYLTNIETADDWTIQTETAISSIKQVVDNTVQLIIQGKNGTNSEDELKIIAANLRSYQDQLLGCLNTQIAGKFILGGANTKTVPFTVDADTGDLLFNGQNVFEVDSIDELNIDKVYYDLGLGLTINDGDIDVNSVYDMYKSGVEIIGVGKDNLHYLIGRLAKAFEENDMAVIDGYGDFVDESGVYDPAKESEFSPNGLFKKLQDGQLNALMSLVEVGEKSNFIQFLHSRTDDSLYQAQVTQNKLEAIQPEEAIMDYKMQEVVYRACLQMGSYILGPSLMDYLK